MRALALPVGEAEGLEAGDRRRRRESRTAGRAAARRAELAGRIRQPGRAVVRPGLRERPARRPEQDVLLAVAHEAGLHEQLDVAVRVGAGDVEARRARASRPRAGAAGRAGSGCRPALAMPDRVELHDRPLVADRLALDADEARDPALLLVDVHQVVRPEGTERQPEQAEHADRRPVDRQPERTRARRRPTGTGATAHRARRGRSGGRRGPCRCCAASAARSSRRGSSCRGLRATGGSDGGAARSPRRGRRARRPSSRRAGGSGSRRRARGGTPWR